MEVQSMDIKDKMEMRRMNPDHIISELDPDQTMCNVLGCYVDIEVCLRMRHQFRMRHQSSNVCQDCSAYYKMLKPGEKWDKKKQKITTFAK